MRTSRAVLALLALSAAACSRSGGPSAAASPLPGSDPDRPLPSPLPEIVARVDGRPISIQQVLPLAKAALDRVSLAERDKRLPAVLRSSIEKYVERELLLQEALRRGISADAEAVDWSYDQMRREHPDEAAWTSFLKEQGTDPQSLKAELRIQRTVAALIDREAERLPISDQELRAAYDANPMRFAAPGSSEAPPFEAARARIDGELRRQRSPQVAARLVAALRAKARIELLL